MIDPYSYSNVLSLTAPMSEEEVDNDSVSSSLTRTVESTSQDHNQKLMVTANAAETQDKQSAITRFLKWLGLQKRETDSATDERVIHSAPPSAIDSVPVLKAPKGIPPHLKTIKLPGASKSYIGEHSDVNINDALAHMKPETIHRIMMIVLRTERELEKNCSLIAIDTLRGFQKQEDLKREALQEITKALENDEQMAKFFEKIQNTAIAVAIAGTILSAIGTGGISAFVAGLFGPSIGAIVTSALAVLPWGAGLAGATAIAGKSYFDCRGGEDAQAFKRFQHEKQIMERLVESINENLNETSLNTNNTERQLIKLASDFVQLVVAMRN